MSAQIRKIIVEVDETHIEMGQAINPPTRRALAMAVVANPYAGRYAENLDELVAIGEELGALLQVPALFLPVAAKLPAPLVVTIAAAHAPPTQ